MMMSKVQQTAPMLRFKGYTDAWVQRKLGETLKDLKSGLSRMLSDIDVGLPVIRANNINQGCLDMENDVKYWYVDDPQGAKTEKYLVHSGDILINFINSEAKMGTATIVGVEPERSTIYTTNILKAQTNDGYDSYFWFIITQTEKYKTDIKRITKPAVNQASFTTVDFKALEYKLPLLREQTAIGNFFCTLDNIITLHKRKLDSLKELKMGYLQQMFPQDGESVPRVRFSGFAGDWQEQKLGDEADIFAGGDINNDKVLEDGKYPVYANALTNDGIVGYYDNDFRIEAPAVTVTGRGDVGYAKARKVNFTPVVRLLAVKSKHDVDFLENAINNHNVFVESTGVPQLTAPQLAKYMISFPSLAEQTAIGRFFINLDRQITEQTQKIEQLKQLKKVYLQKMFVA